MLIRPWAWVGCLDGHRSQLATSSIHFHIRFRGGTPSLIYSSERIASAISSYSLPRLSGEREKAPSSPRPYLLAVRTFKFPEYSSLFPSRTRRVTFIAGKVISLDFSFCNIQQTETVRGESSANVVLSLESVSRVRSIKLLDFANVT